MPEDDAIRDSICDVLRGYARAEIERRATDLVRALDDAALEAIAEGPIDLRALLAQAAQDRPDDARAGA